MDDHEYLNHILPYIDFVSKLTVYVISCFPLLWLTMQRHSLRVWQLSHGVTALMPPHHRTKVALHNFHFSPLYEVCLSFMPFWHVNRTICGTVIDSYKSFNHAFISTAMPWICSKIRCFIFNCTVLSMSRFSFCLNVLTPSFSVPFIHCWHNDEQFLVVCCVSNRRWTCCDMLCVYVNLLGRGSWNGTFLVDVIEL